MGGGIGGDALIPSTSSIQAARFQAGNDDLLNGVVKEGTSFAPAAQSQDSAFRRRGGAEGQVPKFVFFEVTECDAKVERQTLGKSLVAIE